MPTFVYALTRCDGCRTLRRHPVLLTSCASTRTYIAETYNIEPEHVLGCYSCVMTCPQNAIDVRPDMRISRRSATAFASTATGARASPGRSCSGRHGKTSLSPITHEAVGTAIPTPSSPMFPRPTQGNARRRTAVTTSRNGSASTRGGLPRTLKDAGLTMKGVALLMATKTIVEVGIDILVVGAGVAARVPAWEEAVLGPGQERSSAGEANIDRSAQSLAGAVRDQLLGTRWGGNNPEGPCPLRPHRPDGPGAGRPAARHGPARRLHRASDSKWGLPIMEGPETGRYLREGRWQIMIHGESYKPIVARPPKKSADQVFNRICVTHLLMDEKASRTGLRVPSASTSARAATTSSSRRP